MALGTFNTSFGGFRHIISWYLAGTIFLQLLYYWHCLILLNLGDLVRIYWLLLLLLLKRAVNYRVILVPEVFCFPKKTPIKLMVKNYSIPAIFGIIMPVWPIFNPYLCYIIIVTTIPKPKYIHDVIYDSTNWHSILYHSCFVLYLCV